jgi:hypothetical protein
MGLLANGTGLSLEELKKLYGHDPQDFGHILYFKSSASFDAEVNLATDNPTPGAGRIKSDSEKYATSARDFRCCVDFRFTCEDWNDPKHKKKESDGRYSTVEKRHLYLRGLLAGLRASLKENEPLEVALVAHSSILRRWAADRKYHPARTRVAIQF